MAMKLKTFTGEAEVCGTSRRVEWDGDVVHVFGVQSYDDAMRVLGQGPDFPASFNDAQEPETPSAIVVKPATGAPHPDVDVQAHKARDAAAAAATAAAREAAATRARESLEADQAKSGVAAVAPGPRGAKPDDDIPFGETKAPAVAKPSVPEAASAPAGSEDPAEVFLAGLVACDSIRALIKHFHANGLTDHNEIVTICKKHKKVVPALMRVSNIDDRLGRALEALE